MPTQSEYENRLKLHQKSTRGHQIDESTWTAFRREEKKYKSKYLPPSLEEVFDLATLITGQSGRKRPEFVKRFQVKQGCSLAFGLEQIPGLVLLPAAVSPSVQKDLVRAALADYTRLNETNLHAHYLIPPCGIWERHIKGDVGLIHPKTTETNPNVRYEIVGKGPRQLVNNEAASLESVFKLESEPKPHPLPSTSGKPISATNLLPRIRWANLGRLYHWGTKSYDFSKSTPLIPLELRSLCKNLVTSIDWADVCRGFKREDAANFRADEWSSWAKYEPDAGIANFYQLQDTLMGHVDRSEVSVTSPLVSISLGRPAIFLIGGETRDTKPMALLLRSGDVVILSGPCRRAFHGVPRILEDQESPVFLTAGSDDWLPFSEYIRNARININVRQVFPSGFIFPCGS